MAFTLDSQLAKVLAAQAEFAAASGIEFTLPARGDALGLRALAEGTIAPMLSKADPAPDVTFTSDRALAEDGTPIELRWYTKSGAAPGPAIVYVHGGGMIMGSIGDYDPLVRQYVQWTGVPQLAVEYRLAPEVKGETPARDVLAAVRWLHQNAERLEVDPNRIAVMGDSGGGGIGAGAVILARDHGVPLAKQILLYPMLDDRTTDPDPDLVPYISWNYDSNFTGWYALLGDEIGTDEVSPVAAPARLGNFSGLPPAYIEVGTLDIFRDECISYAQRLLRAGIDTDLHVLAGYPHGADWHGLQTSWKDRWKADRVRAMTSF
ncbi:alpha/beta hydrolase [Arthrobacter sedimenti]|uniref:alpha/beta hydrolase n=1 Tax=Arthrobacter sedimenti TaxID=2694931 RepID=UPI000B353B0D|nr:alpha/beta hydrolase [Arthrobacter sedimenti]OUM45085.1 alpha/beta hydrolase [Arthrobacter agilis]